MKFSLIASALLAATTVSPTMAQSDGQQPLPHLRSPSAQVQDVLHEEDHPLQQTGAAAVLDRKLQASTTPSRTVRTEFQTATILHGVNVTLSGEHADGFAQCYINSYNLANRDYGTVIKSMSEDTQWVAEFGGEDDSSSRRRQLQFAPVRIWSIPTRTAPVRANVYNPATAPYRRVYTPPNYNKKYMVFYIGKFGFGPECRYCGNDDRLLHEVTEDESDRRRLVHLNFQRRLQKCLKRSGLPHFVKLGRVEVRYFNGITAKVVEPPRDRHAEAVTSSSSQQLQEEVKDVTTSSAVDTADGTPFHTDRMRTSNKVHIEFTTATILHGVNESLTGENAETFSECYLRTYNEAAKNHGADTIQLAAAEDDAVQQWVLDDDDSDDNVTASAIPSDNNNNRQRLLLTPPKRNRQSFVLTIGKFAFGPECRLCGNFRQLHEPQDGSTTTTAATTTADSEHRAENEEGVSRTRALVHAKFQKGLYHCLRDSGNTYFDRLRKVEVHQLSRTVTPAM